MGCCCCSSNKSSGNDSNTVEMTNAMHSSNASTPNSCKCGKYGKDIKISGNGSFIAEGNGTVLGSCMLDCDTAYFEVKVGENPSGVLVGVKRWDAKRPSSLEIHLDEDDKKDDNVSAWFLRGVTLNEGDVIGLLLLVHNVRIIFFYGVNLFLSFLQEFIGIKRICRCLALRSMESQRPQQM